MADEDIRPPFEGENGNNTGTGPEKIPFVAGEVPVEVRIEALKKALSDAQNNIELSLEDSRNILYGIIGFTIVFILIGFVFAYRLLHTNLPCCWTWQIIYYTTIRITFLSAIFAIANFCFKLIRSYLQIYQKNLHNATIIRSMASLVESALDKDVRNEIYRKLLDIIIEFGDTGLLQGKGEESKIPIETLINLLIKFAEKK